MTDIVFDGEYVFHATALDNLGDILELGFKQGTYFTTTMALAEYYAESVEDDDGRPAVIIGVPVSALNMEHIGPDYIGLEEPITSATGYSSDTAVYNAWEDSDKSVAAAVAITNSFKYATALHVKDGLCWEQF